MIFYKEGKWFKENRQLFTALSQLLTKLLLTMKFAFALLPIAAVLGFVQAGPVFDESLVRALILPRSIYRAHY